MSPQKKPFLFLCLVSFARGTSTCSCIFVDASGSESEVFAVVLLQTRRYCMCGQMPSEINDFGGYGVYELVTDQLG